MARTSGDSVSELRLHTCFNSSFPDRVQANLHFGADMSSTPESKSLYARLGGYDTGTCHSVRPRLGIIL
jgi:hypothetical protein